MDLTTEAHPRELLPVLDGEDHNVCERREESHHGRDDRVPCERLRLFELVLVSARNFVAVKTRAGHRQGAIELAHIGITKARVSETLTNASTVSIGTVANSFKPMMHALSFRRRCDTLPICNLGRSRSDY